MMVKAFKSSLVWRKNYSVYWVIFNIREIPLLRIKSLRKQLNLNKTLTRASSISRLFCAFVANDNVILMGVEV